LLFVACRVVVMLVLNAPICTHPVSHIRFCECQTIHVGCSRVCVCVGGGGVITAGECAYWVGDGMSERACDMMGWDILLMAPCTKCAHPALHMHSCDFRQVQGCVLVASFRHYFRHLGRVLFPLWGGAYFWGGGELLSWLVWHARHVMSGRFTFPNPVSFVLFAPPTLLGGSGGGATGTHACWDGDCAKSQLCSARVGLVWLSLVFGTVISLRRRSGSCVMRKGGKLSQLAGWSGGGGV
jgi:hypothetical protein